jgi:hypothetical protein
MGIWQKHGQSDLRHLLLRLDETLRANNDETLTAAIITEQGGKENHRERDQDCCSFFNQFT